MCSIGWWLRTGPMRGCAGCRPETSSSPFCTGNWPLRRACATSKPARQPCAPALPPRRSGDIALDPRRRQCQAPERGVRRAVRSSGRAGRSRPAAQVGEAVHLINSTGLRLSDLSADWRVSRTASAGRSCTSSTIATPSARSTPPSRRLNDITAAQALPIAAGATYVFDLGYYDFAWWASLDDAVVAS